MAITFKLSSIVCSNIARNTGERAVKQEIKLKFTHTVAADNNTGYSTLHE